MSRWRRAARWVLFAAAGLVALLGLLVAGLLIYLNTASGRQLVARLANQHLSQTFAGKIQITELDRIGLTSITFREVTVDDTQGRRVLLATRLEAHLSLLEVARKALGRGGLTQLTIERAQAERIDVTLYPAHVNELSLASAFALRSGPQSKPSAAPGQQSLAVSLPHIEIAQLNFTGSTASVPPVEGQLTELRGSVQVDEAGTRVAVDQGRLDAKLSGYPLKGDTTFLLHPEGKLEGTFVGAAAGFEVSASYGFSEPVLSIQAEVRDAAPEAVSALLPAWPLVEKISLRVSARGELPELVGRVEAVSRESLLNANFTLTLGKSFKLVSDVEVVALNLELLDTEAPATSLDAKGQLELEGDTRTLRAAFSFALAPSAIFGLELPAADVTGRFSDSELRGRIRVHEPGAPIALTYRLDPTGVLRFDARSTPIELQAVPRLSGLLPVTGSASLSVQGSLEGREVSMSFSVDTRGLTHQHLRTESAAIFGRVRGDLRKPEQLQLDLTVNASQVASSGLRFASGTANARGTVRGATINLELTDTVGPSFTLDGKLALLPHPRLEGLALQARRKGATVSGRLAALELGPGSVLLDGFQLSGEAGTLEGRAKIRDGEVSLYANGERLDLDTLSRVLGLPPGLLSGSLRLHADVAIRPGFQRGTLHGAVASATLGPFQQAALRVDAELLGPQLNVSLAALMADLGAVGFAATSTLGGPALEAASWKGAIGEAELQFDRLKLAWLNPLFAPLAHEGPLAGYANGKISLVRESDEALPSALFVAGTQALALSWPREGEPLDLTGLDLRVGGTVNGRDGDVNLTGWLSDSVGVLSSFVAAIKLDMTKLRREGLASLLEWQELPLTAAVALEERPVDALPEPLRLPEYTGRLRARLSISGNLAHPSYEGSAELLDFSSRRTRLGLPVDAILRVGYQTKTERLSANAQVSQARRVVAQLEVLGQAPEGSISGRAGGGLALRGRGSLLNLPLGVLPAAADAQIVGELSGPIELSLIDGQPSVSASIKLARGAIAQVPVPEGQLDLNWVGDLLRAELRAKEPKGELLATGELPLEFTGVIPRLSQEKLTRVKVQARSFNAGILLPLLSDILLEIGGKLDANMTAELRPDPENEELKGAVTGTLRLSEGRMQLSATGMQLNDVSFTSTATRDGERTLIRVNGLKAKARSKVTNIEARDVTLRLRGLAFESGDANVFLSHPVPILLEGVQQATVTGFAQLRMDRYPTFMALEVNIPVLEARLPKATSRRVIDVDNHPDVVVAQPLSEADLKAHSAGATLWVIRVGLGDSVTLTRSDFTLPIVGRPELRLGEELEVTGQVDLVAGGRAQLLGKTFVVERGVVYFDTGDSKNPRVDVTASWRAPDGTNVFVDIRGTFRKATLSLRSDPPLGSEVELQALLLGGSSGQGDATAGSAGIGIGAGLLGELLADTPLGAVELRTANEASEAAGAYSTYTAAVRLSDEVWFEGSYKRAEDPVSQERGDALSGTVDWRFRRNWSLRTEAGRLGTKIDLLWRYRY